MEKSLPKKTETLVFCEMSPLQRETYKKVLERDLSVVAGSESAGRTAILNIVMQLRKVGRYVRQHASGQAQAGDLASWLGFHEDGTPQSG